MISVSFGRDNRGQDSADTENEFAVRSSMNSGRIPSKALVHPTAELDVLYRIAGISNFVRGGKFRI